MNNLIKGLCAVTFFALSASATAGAGPYVTLMMGASDIEADVDAISAPPSPGTIIDPEVPAFTASDSDGYFALGGGFIMNEYLAFEFLLNQYGQIEDTVNSNVTFDAKARSFTVGVVGKWPLSDNFSLYAKTGIDAWSADFAFKELGDHDGDSGTDDTWQKTTDKDRGYSLFVGLGADYKIMDNLTGFIEYGFHPYAAEYTYYVTELAVKDSEGVVIVPDKSRYETADADLTVSTFSLGLNWKF